MTAFAAEVDTQALSREQVEAFRQDGFLVCEDVFSMEEVERLREACETPEVIGSIDLEGYKTNTVHLLELAARNPVFMELAKSPKIVERPKSPPVKIEAYSTSRPKPPVSCVARSANFFSCVWSTPTSGMKKPRR